MTLIFASRQAKHRNTKSNGTDKKKHTHDGTTFREECCCKDKWPQGKQKCKLSSCQTNERKKQKAKKKMNEKQRDVKRISK